MSEHKLRIPSLSDEEVKKYAAEVLHETEDRRKNAVDEIKKWAEENPELHLRTDQKYIVPFLRVCKYDMDKTKEKMKLFYLLRRDRNEWFRHRNVHDPEIQSLVKRGAITFLKNFDKNRMVLIARIPDSECSIDLLTKVALMLIDIAIVEEELSQIFGLTLIFDLTHVALGQARQVGISKMRHIIKLWQVCQYRSQRIYMVNVPFFINAILAFFLSFMPKKLKKRVHIMQDSDLTKVIEKDILPPEFGGCGETIDDLSKYWLDKLISYNSWYIEDENKFIPE